MKKWIGIVALVLLLTACGKDKTSGDGGGSDGSHGYALTSSAKQNLTAASEQFTLEFSAENSWKITPSDEKLCTLSSTSGSKGTAAVTVTVAPNISTTARNFTLSIKVSGNSSATLCTISQSGLSLPAIKTYSNLKQETKLTSGILDIQPLFTDDTQTKVGLMILGVYPNSPATEAGLKRGIFITSIDGTTLTPSNYYDYYYDMFYPSTAKTRTLKDYEGKSYTLNIKEALENPLIYFSVRTIDNRKIGYIVYGGFDAAFDAELLAAIGILKSKGISDFVLDLRLNGGGHVITADMLCDCIGGSRCQNQVFAYYRYNADRMAESRRAQTASETGNTYDTTQGLFKDLFSYPTYRNLNLSSGYTLGTSTLYCLVNSGTASASELVINALKGVDMPVVLIGQNTHGKNVGMEVSDLTDMTTDEILNHKIDQILADEYLWNADYKLMPIQAADYLIAYKDITTNFLRTVLMRMSTNTLDKKSYVASNGTTQYTLFSNVQKTGTGKYEVLPITFQTYNAKVFGDYQNGFAPDYALNDLKYDTVDFGDTSDPYYGKAISLITGNSTYAPLPKATRADADLLTIEKVPVERRISGMIALRPQVK